MILAAAGLAGLVPAQQALATTPRIAGPIASYACPPVPMWCTRTLRPGITLTHWRAKLHSGTTQNLYKISWKLGDPHVRLMAAALNTPDAGGDIRLGTISHWASASGTSGLLGAINGDFFSYVGWTAGHPSGMLVQSRRVVAFGSGGPGVGYEPDGRMVMGTPSAKPAKFLLGNGQTATIAAFDPGSTLDNLRVRGDQVVLKTVHGTAVNIPGGWNGYVVGGPATPNPFPGMLRGSEWLANTTGSDKPETVAGFRFGDGGGSFATVWLPIVPASGPSVQLGAGQTLVLALAGYTADAALAQLATHSHLVGLSVDAEAWSSVRDVMGGKPQLVKDGKVTYPTAWQNPPMMSGDGWQWEFPHWRPALAETKTRGWLIITGGVHYGNGVYGWNWGRMLVQLGVRNAMGFDNNSSTEMYAPGNGMWSFSPSWQRDITEATALTYH